ncbi:MAG: YCF48-related protein [Candidatus Kapabacteria bacterium]|nr:YCF48-related protein [Candidatus Kapabacteria bacterium]
MTCILTASTLIAQQQNPVPWQMQSPLPAPNVLRKASFVNERVGWAVGRDTVLLFTSDGGNTWVVRRQSVLPRNLFATIQFFDVRAVNENVVWAMANAGLIVSRDGGATWRRATDGGVAIFALDAQHAWLVDNSTSGGVIRRTSDSGTTWSTITVPFALLRDVFFVDTLHGYIASASGVLGTRDGGRTWNLLLSSDIAGTATRLTCVQWATPTIGFAGGEDSTLIRTLDGGRTWQRASLSIRAFDDVRAIRMISASTGYALAGGNVLLATSDTGRTWQQRSVIPSSTVVTDIQFASPSVGYAVGGISFNIEESSVWKTVDSGRTWIQIRGTKNMPLYGIAARSRGSATAVGNTTILSTVDGGRVWATQLPLPGNPDNFAKLYRSVSFPRLHVGYIAGEVGRILKTTDGGATWVQPMRERRMQIDWYDCAFVNDSVGWVVGSNTFRIGSGGSASFSVVPIISRTVDGGTTWSDQVLPSGFIQDTLNSVYAVSERCAFVVGNRGAIYATRDGGATWVRQSSPTRLNLHSVFFVNDSVGWAVGGGAETAVIIATRDGGATWRRQHPPADAALRGVFFVTPFQGYAVGNSGSILATRDGGATWEPQVPPSEATFFDVVFTSPVHGWIVGDGGTILSTYNGGFIPVFERSVSRLDFGGVSVGDTVTRKLDISARYLLAPLVVTAPEGFLLRGAGQFGRRVILVPSLMASTQATLEVSFVPSRDAAVSALLTIESPFIAATVALVGIGLQRPVLRFAPEQERFQFPATLVGRSVQGTLVMRNTGVTRGTVEVRVLSAGMQQQSLAFSISDAVVLLVLEPGQQYPFSITFAPRSLGLTSAILSVRVWTASFDTTYRISLEGLGLQAVVRTHPQHLDVGGVSLTQHTLATISCVNVGNTTAIVQRVYVDPSTSDFRLTSSIATVLLAPQEFLSVPVRFSPTSLGTIQASLVVVYDTDTLRVRLSGVGVPLQEVPVLVSPYDGRINTPVSVVFVWKQPLGGLSYDIQISRDSTFSRVDIQQSFLRSLSYAPVSDLLHSTRYYWRVRSRGIVAVSDWSPVYTFTTVRLNPLLRSFPELVQVSGAVGSSQRGYFTVRSSVRDTILSADFRLLNEGSAYSLRQDQFPLPLAPNVTETVAFDFSPTRVASEVRGILRLIARRDTLLVPFLGEAVERDSVAIVTRIVLQTDRQNVVAGDSVLVRVVMTESRNLDEGRNRGKAQSFTALLRIRNETVLAPTGALNIPAGLSGNVLIGNRGRTVELRNIPRPSGMKSGVLAEFPATVFLGDAASTSIEFLSFVWNDIDHSVPVQSIIDSSLATVVCNVAGKPRLIRRGQPTQFQSVFPVPSSDKLWVSFTLLESGVVSLHLVDAIGNRVKTLVDAQSLRSGEFVEEIDISDVPSGTYTLLLCTPSLTCARRVYVMR